MFSIRFLACRLKKSLELRGFSYTVRRVCCFYHCTSVRVFFAKAIAKAKNVSRTGGKFISPSRVLDTISFACRLKKSLELTGFSYTVRRVCCFYHCTSVRVFFAKAIAKAKNVSRTGGKFVSPSRVLDTISFACRLKKSLELTRGFLTLYTGSVIFTTARQFECFLPKRLRKQKKYREQVGNS